MEKYKRVFLIVLDSLGIGDAHDAAQFDDVGANTLGHICEKVGGLDVPCLEGMGLGNIGQFQGIHALKNQLAYTARLEEVSNGKDTMTGHWEMMGLHITKPFKTFTETGFPKEFIDLFEEKTGRKCVGNYAESGTKILDDWGEHQIKTGDWIVYTSADSVFQIAANEEIIPLEELYKACEIAREIAMDDRWKVGRIIARPFVGKKKGEFVRTANRHDLALKPFGKTVLDSLKENRIEVIGIGKIPDIFVDQGITRKVKTVSNHDGMEKTIEIAKEDFRGLAFLNLVDFDAVYGHRRNPEGYGQAIVEFDHQLEELLYCLNSDDLLMITADHGNDPTYKGTDHTRENVPLIIYSKSLQMPKHLGLLKSYAVIGATIADNFDVENPGIGLSILNQII
ncbi:phosphopentomutase [Massilimicrobiota timonensis]|uniref:phosphopentomutase n=1 Tax=Massilimicrobiota timonensis TaxID=1776392 RepID=UPI00101D0720|nr:phosphopentomutase [Massilimicrobiota timonensis]